MKIYHLTISAFAFLLMSACGSSSPPVSATNPYATSTVATTSGTATYSPNTGAIPGGTRTITYLFPNVDSSYGYHVAYLTNSYDFTETLSVAAGDLIVIEATSAHVYSTSSAIQKDADLSSITVKLDGMPMGGGLFNAQVLAPHSGTLTASCNWPNLLGLFSKTGSRMVLFPYGGVGVAHCVTTAGAPMQCPY